MNFKEGVTARLLQAAPVIALAGDRINWVVRPQLSALPALTLQIIGDPRPQHLKGFDGARGTRLQIDAWAETSAAAGALASAAIAALAEPLTISGKQFGGAQVDGPRDLGQQVGGSFVHRQSADLIIRHVGD
jgi:hypothetical protein